MSTTDFIINVYQLFSSPIPYIIIGSGMTLAGVTSKVYVEKAKENIEKNYRYIFSGRGISRYTKLKSIEMPPEFMVKATDKDFEENDTRFKLELTHFVEVMSKHKSPELLQALYTNAKDIKIIKNFEAGINNAERGSSGLYYGSANKIELMHKSAIYHELMHMASARKNGGNYYIGFSYNNVGDGLNEGYTELMTKRYFNTTGGSSYKILVNMMSKVEEIVGQEKMEKYYLQSNLTGLMNELYDIDTDYGVDYFVTDMDKLYYLIQMNTKKEENRAELQGIIYSINTRIVCWKLQQLTNQLSNNEITTEEAIVLFNYFFDTFDFNKSYYNNNIDKLENSIAKVKEDCITIINYVQNKTRS
jgi:hypothetical protein